MAEKAMTAVGDAQIDTAQFKWGTASGLFDGTGDWLTTPDTTDWSMGDITIECWYRQDVSTGGAFGIVGQTGGGTARWVFYTEGASRLLKFAYNNGTSFVIAIEGATIIADDTWYHVAFVRSGDTFTIYLNGVREATVDYAAGTIDMTSTLFVAQSGVTEPVNGWLDELRIRPAALYSGASFTVPTNRFYYNANNSLLLHFEGTDAGTTFTDSSADTTDVAPTHHFLSLLHPQR